MVEVIENDIGDYLNYILISESLDRNEAENEILKKFIELTENKSDIYIRRYISTEYERDFGEQDFIYRSKMRFLIPKKSVERVKHSFDFEGGSFKLP